MTYGQSHATAPVPVAVAYAPEPVRYDTAYRLDAGDKLRVVVNHHHGGSLRCGQRPFGAFLDYLGYMVGFAGYYAWNLG